MWIFRLLDWPNAFAQYGQTKGFSLVWVRKWHRRLPDWTNDFSHWSHLNGLTLAWKRRWSTRLDLPTKRLWHTWHSCLRFEYSGSVESAWLLDGTVWCCSGSICSIRNETTSSLLDFLLRCNVLLSNFGFELCLITDDLYDLGSSVDICCRCGRLLDNRCRIMDFLFGGTICSIKLLVSIIVGSTISTWVNCGERCSSNISTESLSMRMTSNVSLCTDWDVSVLFDSIVISSVLGFCSNSMDWLRLLLSISNCFAELSANRRKWYASSSRCSQRQQIVCGKPSSGYIWKCVFIIASIKIWIISLTKRNHLQVGN